jgi:hypothetical protein
LSWSSQFNITDSKFESQVVRLERQLHEWRIYLTDLPDLKFDYNQTTFEQ